MIQVQMSTQQLDVVSNILETLFASDPENLELEMNLGYCSLSVNHEVDEVVHDDEDEEADEDDTLTSIVLQIGGTCAAGDQTALVTLNFDSLEQFLEWRKAEASRQYAQRT